jgi:PhoH-like ATPase
VFVVTGRRSPKGDSAAASTSGDRGVRAGSGRMQVVIDTSVLLADPESLDGFPGADVVLPVTVIEELDAAKSRIDDQGAAARRVVRRLEELRASSGGDLRRPVPVGNGSSLRVELNGLRLDVISGHGLRTDRGDNRILAAALGLRETEADVTLVSVDVNLRVKAAALGLVARDWHPVRHRVDPRPGWRELEVPASLIDAVYQDSAHLPEELAGTIEANEFLVLRNGSQSALCRVRDQRLVRVKQASAWGLEPRSKEQIFALDLLLDESVPVVGLSGPAGTGKTILALAAGLEQTFEPSSAIFDRLIILRPVQSVGGQDLGFLPGTVEEKLGPWFDAVIDALVALGDRLSYPDARRMVDMWVQQGRMSLDAVTYLRGRSLRRSFVLVDESQNLEQLTLKTILTRVGEGSKVVFLGDTSQIDNPYVSRDSNALAVLTDRLAGQELFGHLTLTRGERSPVATLAADLL